MKVGHGSPVQETQRPPRLAAPVKAPRLEAEAFLICRVRFRFHTSVRWDRALPAQKRLKLMKLFCLKVNSKQLEAKSASGR